MSERNIQITNETYIVHEKLDRQSYNVKTAPHTLDEKVKETREAGVNLEFYAHIPQLEARDENALIRRYELIGDDKTDKPVPKKFMGEVFALDGLYLLTSKTSDGKLKVAREIQGGNPGATTLTELDDNWDIFVDPETAALLELTSADTNSRRETSHNPFSSEILNEIQKTRIRVGLTSTDIQDRRAERKARSRIR